MKKKRKSGPEALGIPAKAKLEAPTQWNTPETPSPRVQRDLPPRPPSHWEAQSMLGVVVRTSNPGIGCSGERELRSRPHHVGPGPAPALAAAAAVAVVFLCLLACGSHLAVPACLLLDDPFPAPGEGPRRSPAAAHGLPRPTPALRCLHPPTARSVATSAVRAGWGRRRPVRAALAGVGSALGRSRASPATPCAGPRLRPMLWPRRLLSRLCAAWLLSSLLFAFAPLLQMRNSGPPKSPGPNSVAALFFSLCFLPPSELYLFTSRPPSSPPPPAWPRGPHHLAVRIWVTG